MQEPSHEFFFSLTDNDRGILTPDRVPFVFRRPIELPCRRISLAKLRVAIERENEPDQILFLLCSDPGLLCRFIRHFAKFDSKNGTMSLELETILADIERHRWRFFCNSIQLKQDAFVETSANHFDLARMARHCRFMAYVCREFASDIVAGFSPFQAAILGALHHLPAMVLENSARETFNAVAEVAAANSESIETAFERIYRLSLRDYGQWIGKSWRFDDSSVVTWQTADDQEAFTLMGSVIRIVNWMSYGLHLNWEPWSLSPELEAEDQKTYQQYRSTIEPIAKSYRQGVRPAA